jgi:hypothetical protein
MNIYTQAASSAKRDASVKNVSAVVRQNLIRDETWRNSSASQR